MTKKIKEPTVIYGPITPAQARDPKTVEKKRREWEAAERETKRQQEEAKKNQNIQRTPVKQTMRQKMEAAALAKASKLEEEKGKLQAIAMPNGGSMYARIEPELMAEIIQLQWTIWFHEDNWAKDRKENFIEDGDQWTPTMTEQWELKQEANKTRMKLAPKGGAASKSFWGCLMGELVGEQPKNVDGFDYLRDNVPFQTRLEFLENWAEAIQEQLHEAETTANQEIDDSGLQSGSMTERGCYIGDGEKLNNAQLATGMSRTA